MSVGGTFWPVGFLKLLVSGLSKLSKVSGQSFLMSVGGAFCRLATR